MAGKKKIKKEGWNPNPTGKGGFKERPQDIATPNLGNMVTRLKKERQQIKRALAFRDKLQEYKDRMVNFALNGTGSKEEATSFQLCNELYRIVERGEIGLDTILSQLDGKPTIEAPRALREQVRQVAIDALTDPNPQIRLKAAEIVKAELEANSGHDEDTMLTTAKDEYYRERKLRMELEQRISELEKKLGERDEGLTKLEK